MNQLFKKLTSLLRKKPAPIFSKEHNLEMELAFECEGVRTFTPKDINDLPAMRGLMTHMFYAEMEMRYRSEDLALETALEEEILDQPKITMQDIITLKLILRSRRERMALPFETDSLLKLASVAFIDEGENPFEYNNTYNAEVKIPRWKRNTEIIDFFLQTPILGLHGYMKQQDAPIRECLKDLEEIKKLQSELYRRAKSKPLPTTSKESASPSPAGSPSRSTIRPSVS